MYLFLYLIRGFALIWYLISPTYRRSSNARWRATRPHRVVIEVGTGIVGLIFVGALLVVLARNLIR